VSSSYSSVHTIVHFAYCLTTSIKTIPTVRVSLVTFVARISSLTFRHISQSTPFGFYQTPISRMAITHHNAVSIAELVVYVPCLITSIFLAIRHGFGKSAGWYFLIVFCLARTIGPAMQLATISNPTNTSLYTGYTILQSVGLSPLLLATLGLLGRLLNSINRSHTALVNHRVLKFIELLLLVALILAIVGGVNASENAVDNGGVYKAPTISKAGSALFIVSYVAIVVFTILISFSVRHAEGGEKRILLAVIMSLPLLLIRLIYSVISTFSHSKLFSPFNGSIVILLCVALIEEFIVVVLYEATGLTLNKISEPVEGVGQIEAQDSHQDAESRDSAQHTRPMMKQENIALKIAKKTLIGKIILPSGPQEGRYEMEHRRNRR